MKHKIILIGFLSNYSVYIDIPRDEAIKRYLSNEDSFTDENIIVKEFECEDSFICDDPEPIDESVVFTTTLGELGLAQE